MDKSSFRLPGQGQLFPSFLLGTGLLVLLSSILWLPQASAQKTSSPDCVSLFPQGSINWSTGIIQAIGKAGPGTDKNGNLIPAPGSARTDAGKKIIQLLKKVAISHSLTVDEYAAGDDVILAGIEKTALDARITRQYYTSALDVEVIVETLIYGGFLQLVLPDHIRQISEISTQKSEKQPPKPANHLPRTGLIIDARGLGLEPVLYPTIVSEQGDEIYSSVFITREFAVQYGVSTYFCNMDAAKAHERIGSNPLVFKGLRKGENKSSSIVISMADTRLIEKVTERHSFFRECRVVIVTDQ